MNIKLVLLVFGCASLMLGQQPDRSNLSVRPNSSKGIIELHNGHIDAVRASLDLDFALGPSLPGRIKTGFEWNLRGWTGFVSGINSSSIRPIVWPREVSLRPDIPQATDFWTWANDQGAAIRTVKLIGETKTYIRISDWNTPNLTTRYTQQELLNTFVNLGIPLPQSVVQYVIYATSDGTGFYLEGFRQDRTGTVGNPLYLGFCAVIQGDIGGYWNMDNRHTSYILDRWGGRISYTETVSSTSPFYTAILKNEEKPDEWIQLEVQAFGAVTVEPVSLNLNWAYPHGRGMEQALVGSGIVEVPPYDTLSGKVKVVITNSFDLSNTEVFADYKSKADNYPSPDSYEWNVQDVCYTGKISFVLKPYSITQKSTSGDSITSFDWGSIGQWEPVEAPSHRLTILHPSGLQEVIDSSYGTNLTTWSGEPYFTYMRSVDSPTSSRFAGFFTPDGLGFSDKESSIAGLCGIVRVISTDTARPSIGKTTLITHVVPRLSFTGGSVNFGRLVSGTVSFTQPQHVTNILSYDTANVTTSSSYRGIRLVHAGGATWTAGQTQGQDAYLFYSSAILQAQEIYGTGAPYNASDGIAGFVSAHNWDPSDPAVESVITYDGWGLKTWLDPTGDPFLYPNPVPSKITTVVGLASNPRIPVNTIINGDAHINGSRDAWGPIEFENNMDAPSSSVVPPLISKSIVNPIYSWGSDSPTINGSVKKTITLTRHWDPILGKLLEDSSINSLSGSSIPSIIKGASSPLPLNALSRTYDTMGRQLVVQDQRGASVVTTANTYDQVQSKNPNPITVMVNVSSPDISAPDFNINNGKAYTYGPPPHYFVLSESDLLSGRTISYERNIRGQITKTTDSLSGIIILTAYDDLGRVTSTERVAKGTVGSLVTQFRYDKDGLWKEETKIIQGKSLTTRAEFDAFGREIKVTRPDGNTQSKEYDGWGQVISVTPWMKPLQSFFGNYEYKYDYKGKRTKEIDPKGRVIHEYPSDPYWGLQTSDGINLEGIIYRSIDDRGNSTIEVQDLLGHRVGLVDENGEVVRFSYDKYGNLVQSNNAGQLRNYLYNEIGWLLSRDEPEEGLTAYKNFTALGTPRLILMKGRDGLGTGTSEVVLDEKHRTTRIVSKDEGVILSDKNISYRNDFSVPTLMTETQPFGDIREDYGYDDIGRLVSKAITDGTQAFGVSRQLDEAGNILRLSYPAGGGKASQAQTWEYDIALRPVQTKLDGALRAMKTYDQVLGTSVTDTLIYGNGATTQWITDQGELTRTNHAAQAGSLLPTGVQSNSMTWTAGGLLLTRGTDSFGYDSLGRLVHSITSGVYGETAEQWYGFDRYGNRTYSDFLYTAPNGPQKPAELLSGSSGKA